MRITDSTGGCWPTPLQELLLKATLLKTEEAVLAWEQWSAQDGLDRLDNGSYRLLPLAHRNLESLGYREPILMRLRGIRRRTWCENHLLFRRIVPVLQMFRKAGITTLLLKGTALSLLHYRDFGLRPMQDVDIMVPEERALDAFSLLQAQGWLRNTLPAVKPGRFFLSYRQSADFTREPQEQLDLHWHVLFEACYRDADQPFWEAAIPVEFEGCPTLALCPTDQLLHVCVHGVSWNDIPPLRWVTDASWVLETSAIDWQRLVQLAATYRVIPPLRDALRYLVNTFEASVPEEVVRKLEAMPVTSTEQMEYQYYVKQLKSPGTGQLVRVLYPQYRRSVQGKGLLTQAFGILLFLQHYWNLDKPWRTIPTALKYGFRRMRMAWSARRLKPETSSS